MAVQTEQEVSALRERADRAEAELAALRGDISTPAAKAVIEDKKLETAQDAGESQLRKDAVMAHLLDALARGKDIGHYGRLVFAIVARHFMPHDEVLHWLTRDPDFEEAKAAAMLKQVEERGYNPPKRERIMQWQKEQEFPIIPNVEDPDCGNVYRSFKFPDAVYEHIEEYQEHRIDAAK